MTTNAVCAALLLVGAGSLCHVEAAAPASTFPVLSGPFFGQQPPGMQAEMFAPGIVSSEHHDDGPPAFTPDGRECFWRVNGERDGADVTGAVFWSREVNGRWSEPRVPPFAPADGAYCLVMQPDGRRLYFTARRPAPGSHHAAGQRLFVDRTPTGWSEPRTLDLPVDPSRVADCISVSTDGSLLAVLESPGAAAGVPIVRMRWTNGRLGAPEPLGVVPMSPDRVFAPAISPDGGTLVFTTDEGDRLVLMASVRTPGGDWTRPERLGDNVNAGRHTKFAAFSPDGRYLFLVSDREAPNRNPRKLWRTDAFHGPQTGPLCDVWWVDARGLGAVRR